LDGKRKVQRLHRLRNNRIETGLCALLGYARRGIRSVRDKAYGCSPSTTYLPRELEAINDRHVDVNQRHVGQTCLDFAQSLRCAVRGSNIIAEQPQQLSGRIGNITKVIDNQDFPHGGSSE
jgi:hypothetical protein